ncbi:hypothetical protein CKM354_000439800 [Cercospora kikuchii]|uniref:Polyketide synthase n=1 Tax=Cercospora kikuchii TaxID=84275 RepID=A0A9P3CD68_9PEZI|nr:uncharacterized protein CKM354_000439800 [Cercospora kikuchii]GIZ41082.1 hypothetical protein CKM354_000439800 [Cercospora kikuchii]
MSYINEPIAVIGSACKFAGGSTSPSKLWSLLKEPKDVSRRIDRFRAENWHNENGHYHGASNVLDAYLLDQDCKGFDAQFFSISGNEADSIDPQQRVLLETVYEGIESAGLAMENLQGSSTAVYVGVMCDDYSDVVYNDGESIPKYAATGTARSILSNRVSYFFDWTGPSMTIDTACSSSLVGVHQAVQVLRSGESSLAVAAGSNLIFGPKMLIAESNLNMLSPTGKSRMWSEDADGYARGEGVACVVLKRLSDAIADDDDIECIIRETGVNQDGRTSGITMPSSQAQAALIRQTYAKAGLDPQKATDRCQYFEAHGTGTQAGDPREAGAIHEAFFGQTSSPRDANDPLFVGSVKTVIGHTEGTAGIAGLLKASLAVQHGEIPPNLWFKTLNPSIKPFYDHLKIPTELTEWPQMGHAAVRRASVNSFGFGGTNAHAIIEEYRPTQKHSPSTTQSLSIPFVLSATSEKSLVASVKSHQAYLAEHPDLDLTSAALTLARRSVFPYRIAFSGIAAQSLADNMQRALDEKSAQNQPLAIRSSNAKARRIVGIFTGQGAQWAGMGRGLILTSPTAKHIIRNLESSLAQLPSADRPRWSLEREIMALAPESRIGEGLMSQPLCTALQVLLVDLLRAAGITFDAVVGHSSGEIGAAYAAGLISATDAIRIAYYRGLYAHLAQGSDGAKGGMLAAGTSFEDATDLCQLRRLRGKLQVAACNANASVTLSGDLKTAELAMEIFQDEGKFARQLKVDTAYHSHHMQPCSVPYVAALEACKIKLQEPSGACSWYSSVVPGRRMDAGCSDVTSTYWRDNMVQPVFFAQALSEALDNGPTPNLIIEVGPHPALKGPAGQTIQDTLGQDIPYTGVLSRGKNDVESFANALGQIWAHLGPSTVDMTAFTRMCQPQIPENLPLLKGLPSYTWDHSRAHWYESRMSKTQRLRKEPPHALLGVRTSDEGKGEMRWRNYIKPAEMPWLAGHKIQGQILFPGSGFAVLALESALSLVEKNRISLIEITDFTISRALSFPSEDASVETLFTLADIKEGSVTTTASFTLNACLNAESGAFSSIASGKLVLHMGDAGKYVLPEKPETTPGLRNVETEEFYKDLARIGYNYDEMFKGIVQLQRMANACSGTIVSAGATNYRTEMMLHPAPFDIAFQASFAALGAPGDGRLWTLHIPTHIDRISFNPHAGQAGGSINVELPFNAVINTGSTPNDIVSDIDLYDANGHGILQVEGLHVSPISTPTAASDRPMFAEMQFSHAEPDVRRVEATRASADPRALQGTFPERCMFFYLKQAFDATTPEQRSACDEHRISILNWAAHLVDSTSRGLHPHLKPEWCEDTFESLKPHMDEWLTILPDFDKLIFVGERLLPFVRGEISMLEEYRNHNILEWLYKEAIGTAEYNTYLGGLVKQLSFRYPQMNILEIGAGTGSATQATIRQIESGFGSYTYTDISTAFFPDAQEIFKHLEEKFNFQKLNIESNVAEQGFSEHGYDVIIASNVLHATHSLETTLKNTRALLKPGGCLIVLEVTATDWLRTGFMLCGIADWWAGRDDGRQYGPTVTEERWNELFRSTGFSGVETSVGPRDYMTPYSVMLTQAVDAQISLIRQPLYATQKRTMIDDLVIVGGGKLASIDVFDDVTSLLQPFAASIRTATKIEDLLDMVLHNDTVVVSLTELDEPVFSPFTTQKYEALQRLTATVQNVLWITHGARGGKPYSNMMHGIARCLLHERSDSRFQIIDYDIAVQPEARYITETLLRLHFTNQWSSFAKPYDALWSFEREIYVDENGQTLIARYGSSARLDDRYNSSRRVVKSPVDPSERTVELVLGHSWDLREFIPPQCSSSTPSHTRIASTFSLNRPESSPGRDRPSSSLGRNRRRSTLSHGQNVAEILISKSLLRACRIRNEGFFYLALGDVMGTKVLVLTPNLRSKISVPVSSLTPCNVPAEQEAQLLKLVELELMAEAVLDLSRGRGELVVHEPTLSLADALARRAKERRVSLIMTSSHLRDPLIRLIPASTPARAIQKILPATAAVFLDLTESSTPTSMSQRLRAQLSGKCKLDTRDAIWVQESEPAIQADASVSAALMQSLSRAVAQLSGDMEPTEMVGLDALSDRAPASTTEVVVDWMCSEKVHALVYPPEQYTKFKGDVTYLLVGMTGELGLSLSQWMIDRGAKYIALTSRNPNIDPKWLSAMRDLGATVQSFAMDVTNPRSLLGAYKQIKKSMPPVAGVCNGAMVLTDGLLANMPYDTFNSVIRPKVEGTILLDEIFSDTKLDFFIMFSSLTCVTGNIGQSPYAASNCFMVAMAESRRKRGLAGSVINLAGIFGIGYITRTDKKIHERLENMGYGGVSEWDFHQFFAEAADASPNSACVQFEVSNGLTSFHPKDPAAPAWLQNSKFSRYILSEGGNGGAKASSDSLSIKAQLAEQTADDGVYHVLLSAFIAMLYQKLNMPAEENSISPESGLVELGTDSLVAVDLRTWFTKELGVEVQILSLLGGSSIGSLIADVASKLDKTLTPNLGGAPTDTKASSAAKAPVKAKVPSSAPSEPMSHEPVPSKHEPPNPAPSLSVRPEPVRSDTAQSTTSPSSSTGSEYLTDSVSSLPDHILGQASMVSTPATELSSFASSESLRVAAMDHNKQKVVATAVPEMPRFVNTFEMPYGCAQFWYTQQTMSDPHTSNIQFRLEVNSELDIPRLKQVIKTLGQRHEALRACFYLSEDRDDGTEAKVGILPESKFDLSVRNIHGAAEADDESQALLNRTWDIERGEVASAILLSLNQRMHYLLFGFQHIAIDGFSFNLLLNEMNALYAGQTLPNVGYKFSEWALEQRRQVESGLLSEDLSYWKNQLKNALEPLPLLPMAHVDFRPSPEKYEFEESDEVTLDAKTANSIRNLCKRHKVSVFTYFLVIFKILLFRFVDADTVCIGMADAGRSDSRTHRTVGYLLNLLPLVFERGAAGERLGDALKQARTTTLSALSHSRVPFTLLLNEMKTVRSDTYNPLFQAFIDFRQINADPGVLNAKPSGRHAAGRTPHDLVLDITTVGNEEIKIIMNAQKCLYSHKATQSILKSYLHLVKTFALESDFSLGKIDMSTTALFDPATIEKARELAQGELRPYDNINTLPHLIEEHRTLYANDMALKDASGLSMTYHQMGLVIDSICLAMQLKGVGEGALIGIYQKPTAYWICSLLAIWKVGAIYVPLDTRESAERLRSIINDCQPALILTLGASTKDAEKISFGLICALEVGSLPLQPSKSVAVLAKSDRTSTVLYTSGSTGKPKGIRLTHFSLLHASIMHAQSNGMQREYMLQQSAFSFDLGLGQVMMALFAGGAVLVASSDQRADPAQIANVIADEGITSTIATPSEYNAWMAHGFDSLQRAHSWKFAISGGEKLTHTLLDSFRTCALPELKVINLYGPAEASIGATSCVVDYSSSDAATSISIGRPIPNYAIYVVDSKMQLLPAGVDGELVIAGAGVAEGYLNLSELTAEKFIPDRITAPGLFNEKWSKLYRTGDKGCMRDDGTFLFKGRIAGDSQVKVNGVRIELSSVEHAILEASKSAVVHAVCSVRDGVPVAHVEFDDHFPKASRQQTLRSLGGKLPLPRYMVPGVFLEIAKVPLTKHGKLDRKAIAQVPLQKLNDGASNEGYELSETESTLKRVWEKVLPTEIAALNTIRPDSDFFQCGGSSFSLIKVQHLIRKELHISLSVAELLRNTDLRSMAAVVAAASSLSDIDWDAETALESSLVDIASCSTARPPTTNQGLTIAITGATGYLGRFFLKQLIEHPRVHSIHCLAVRSPGKFREFGFNSTKIITHLGDLAEPNLGLSDDSFQRLSQTVDRIFHLGASRSFWDSYHILKGPNFHSTREVIRLSAADHVPAHFISSSGVLDLATENDKRSTLSVPARQPPVDGTSGYIASKWASERYITNAVDRFRLPMSIHRVTPNHGSADASSELLSDFLATADSIKTLPNWSGWSGKFDIIRSEQLVSDIVSMVINDTAGSGLDHRADLVHHHSCQHTLSMKVIEEYIASQEKDRSAFELCPPHEWVGKAKAAGFAWHIAVMDVRITMEEDATTLELRR